MTRSRARAGIWRQRYPPSRTAPLQPRRRPHRQQSKPRRSSRRRRVEPVVATKSATWDPVSAAAWQSAVSPAPAVPLAPEPVQTATAATGAGTRGGVSCRGHARARWAIARPRWAIARPRGAGHPGPGRASRRPRRAGNPGCAAAVLARRGQRRNQPQEVSSGSLQPDPAAAARGQARPRSQAKGRAPGPGRVGDVRIPPSAVPRRCSTTRNGRSTRTTTTAVRRGPAPPPTERLARLRLGPTSV